MHSSPDGKRQIRKCLIKISHGWISRLMPVPVDQKSPAAKKSAHAEFVVLIIADDQAILSANPELNHIAQKVERPLFRDNADIVKPSPQLKTLNQYLSARGIKGYKGDWNLAMNLGKKPFCVLIQSFSAAIIKSAGKVQYYQSQI